jgi:nitric oxide reductase subunit C
MRGLSHAALILLALSVAACGSRAEAGAQRALGERLFTRHCASCHSTAPDTVVVGPSLAGVADRAEQRVAGMDARTYLETSILDPGDYVVEGFSDVMPRRFGETLDTEELRQLIDYLSTLN